LIIAYLRGVSVDVTKAEAIMTVQDLLISEFGESLKTRSGDQVLLIRDNVSEYDDAWLVPFNTRTYLDGGPPPTGLLPSAVLVPKDRRVPPHYPPTALPVAEYLAKVRDGEMHWSSLPRTR
jgi:Immunity protein 35